MKTKITLLLLLLSCPLVLRAQDTEFWFAVPHLSEYYNGVSSGYLNRPALLVLSNGTDKTAHVKVVFYDGGTESFIEPVIAPGDVYKHDFTSDTDMNHIQNPRTQAGAVTKYGMHITSDVKITAYYMANNPASRDIFTLKGRQALGTSFYVPMQSDNYCPTGTVYTGAFDQIDIVATTDGTVVTVVPKAAIFITPSSSSAAETTIVRTLNKGETLKIMELTINSGSLAGTSITATQPVAVTTTEDLVCGDTSGDQIVPVNNVGRRYVIAKGYMITPASERIYMVSTVNGTSISVNGTNVASSLNAGSTYVYNITTDAVYVEASNPIYCYQRTGNAEQGAALLPSMYAIGQNRVSYFQVAAESEKGILIFKTGTESSFTITYNGTTSPLSVGAPITIPGVSEWKCARFDLPATANEKVVTIANPQSIFSFGYIASNTVITSTSFGYLSAFGDFSFQNDTIYKCAGSTIPLEGGYAMTYDWLLPNGTHLNTATINAIDTGKYTLTMFQDPLTVVASVSVFDRFTDGTIASSGGNDVGAGSYTYSVNFDGQPLDNVTYVWKVDGIQVSTAATYSAIWSNTDDKLISVILTDAVLGCSKTLSIAHHTFPDNISDADCFVEPPATVWGIKNAYNLTATGQVSNWMIPFVGDLDDDGIPEIVCWGMENNYYSGNLAELRTILIYDGKTRLLKKKINISLSGAICMEAISGAPYGLVKVSGRPAGTNGLIIVACKDYFLRAYDVTGALVWKSDVVYSLASGVHDYSANVSFADFNHDGYPEVYIRNKIYNAATGKLLVEADGGTNTGASWAHWSHSGADLQKTKLTAPFAADILPEYPGLELIAGNEIYASNIVDSINISLNSLKLVKKITPPVGVIADGHIQVADFNNDGHLDVFISNRSANIGGSIAFYVWDVYNNTVSTPYIGVLGATLAQSGKSIPLIGDMNKDGKLEVLIQYNAAAGQKYKCFTYEPATKSFGTAIWEHAPSEDSFSNTATMFDFNLDGNKEVLLSDQAYIRILDAATGSQHNALSFVENTFMQYPVIADVDADGIADVVAVGSDMLNILQFDGSQWAPARKVWNQYMYNALNVNEDLTIPKYQLNPATVFPGIDGASGTADDVRPFNNFLEQQTALNKNGDPLWLTPNGEVTDQPEFSYEGTITVKVHNVGDAAFKNPFKITVYKDAVGNAIKYTYSYPNTIPAGVTTDITFTIPGFRTGSWTPFTSIVIRINDNGNGYNDQAVCDSATRDFATGLIAFNDYSVTSDSVVNIDVLDNDLSGSCSLGHLSAFNTIVGSGLHHGTLTKNADSTFTYKTTRAFTGVDSVDYYIKCGLDSSAARVYILKLRPSALQYVACPGAAVALGFTAIPDVHYYWYNVETGGTVVGGGSDVNILTVTKGTVDATWWVEPQYKGKVFPRYRVDLLTSENCGTATPVGCAANGTLLFKEDFDKYGDGLNPASDNYSTEPLLTGTTSLALETNQAVGPWDGKYALAKTTNGIFWDGDWNIPDDHTHPADATVGRFMLINADYNPDIFYTYKIDNLCPGSVLSFSVAVADCRLGTSGTDAILTFLLENPDTEEILVDYEAGGIPLARFPSDWLYWGFNFTIPDNQTSVVLKIKNNKPGGGGNDFGLDDIEIRFCSPPVKLNVADTTVCSGTEFNLTGDYDDTDGAFKNAFGDDLWYRWEYRSLENTDWMLLDAGPATNPLSQTWTIDPVTKDEEGYYRLLVSSSSTNIDMVNCRAVSDSILLSVKRVAIMPDIRVDVCSSPPRTIYLTDYLDTLDYTGVIWEKVSPGAPDIIGTEGAIISDELYNTSTHTYRYTMQSYCGASSAIAYIHPLYNKIVRKIDTIIICNQLELSKHVQLNQILGLELDGILEYGYPVNPDNTVVDNVDKISWGVPGVEALIFNAFQAFIDATDYDYNIIYEGHLAKKFVFTYTVPLSRCLGGPYTRSLVLIVTDNFFFTAPVYM